MRRFNLLEHNSSGCFKMGLYVKYVEIYNARTVKVSQYHIAICLFTCMTSYTRLPKSFQGRTKVLSFSKLKIFLLNQYRPFIGKVKLCAFSSYLSH